MKLLNYSSRQWIRTYVRELQFVTTNVFNAFFKVRDVYGSIVNSNCS